VATDALASATFAVVSCSNYPAGYFNVYREIANQEVDAVLHLGDYLYEYDKDGYASERAEEFGRVVMPETELLSLDDYRTRYAQYHSDANLQDCHGAHPFVIVWDDHEVANDAWVEGAENHDPDTQGDYSERRAAAIQAWYEWLPVRPPASEQDIIYRSFQYGDLLDLIMLDTRHVARDQQVDYGAFVNGGVIDSVAVNAATSDSGRTLLGSAQLDWVKSRLTDSTARWQVLGQQVLMARQPLTEPLVRALTPGLAGEDPIGEAVAAVLAMSNAKNTPEDERTEEQQALLDTVIPFNPDAWDGYDFEREDLLNHAAQLQSRLVVLAGDTHNGWASQITTADGTNVGVEFGGPSVSSPGAEAVIGVDNAGLFGPFAVNLIDDLNYANLISRGYMAVTFGPDRVSCDFRYITAVDSTEYAIDEESAQSFTVNRDDLLLS
jgi:alkaline phosphatase D